MLGVSVVICCHNSADTLAETLRYLAAQSIADNIPWEVIIIDNASTDQTVQVALDAWPQQYSTHLRIVQEPKLGLIYARYRGLAEARYEVISFIDDDNWVCSSWIQTVSEIMGGHPRVGACGGQNIPEFATPEPEWFGLSGKSYAVGSQGPASGGDITWSRARLVGAGLTIRKAAWQQLVDNGFQSMLVGCQGKTLNRGEDTELCFALVLAGWHLWYEPRLVLRHFLTADRLHWHYLRKLRRGGGQATVGFDPYRLVLESCNSNHFIDFWWPASFTSTKHPYGQPKVSWWRQQFLAIIKELLCHPWALIQSLTLLAEGNANVLDVEMRIGRLIELIKTRNTYDVSIRSLCKVAWRKQYETKS